MNIESFELNCPVCNSRLLVDKKFVLTCSNCKNELELIWYDEKVVSIRRFIYHPHYYIQNDLPQMIIDLVEKNLSPEKWGFSKNTRFPNSDQKGTAIYDSEFCRVKFVLESSDYFPQHDTKIFYSRLHAPDNEHSMTWNDGSCRCWHPNIVGLTLPFIEGISPQHLAENTREVWDSLTEKLNINYPASDMVEYPLRLHAKIWKQYKEKLFSIFDLRNPRLWEEYSKYSNEYNEAFNKRLSLSRKIARIC